MAHLVLALLLEANRVYCKVMFGVRRPFTHPLPESGPALLVSDHSSLADPLVLFATANRPIRFLMAREFYEARSLHWLFRLTGSIPISRGRFEIAPIRALLHALVQGDVVGVFPEGGITEHRKEAGYPGVGYAALKSGAPVIPVSIVWDHPRPLNLLLALTQPARVTVHYGAPLFWGKVDGRYRDAARRATDRILQAIRELKKD